MTLKRRGSTYSGRVSKRAGRMRRRVGASCSGWSGRGRGPTAARPPAPAARSRSAGLRGGSAGASTSRWARRTSATLICEKSASEADPAADAPDVRTCAALAAALLLLALPSAARADVGFVSPGPIASIEVSDDLACQVAYAGQSTYEFFPPDHSPGDCGTLIAVDGTLYAPDFDEEDASATSQLGSPRLITPVAERLSGSGTAADPFVITTDTTVADGTVEVQQRVSYAHGQPFYRVDIAVRNQGTSKDIRVYHAGDCFASGSDIGYGFIRPEIKSFGCAQNVNNTPAARTIQMLPLSAGSSGVEDRYSDVWRRIGGLETLDNSCQVRRQPRQRRRAGPADRRSGRSRAPSTRCGSRSPSRRRRPWPTATADALPDAWESGAGTRSDAENLAPLGASPTRKDIFVHVDWMGDCQPAGDFARKAIEMFE